MRALAWRRLLLASCVAAGCGSGSDLRNAWHVDASFGTGAPNGGADGGVSDGGASDPSDDGSAGGARVRVRLLHGLVNVGPLLVCHDPDLVLDAPDTPLDESADGPAAATLIVERAIRFGDDEGYVSLEPLEGGTLTFHRPPPPSLAQDFHDGGLGDAGVAEPEADAGSASDAGADTMDSGASDGDGSQDGDGDGSQDGDGPSDGDGDAADASTPAMPDPCAPETREAAMPVPFTAGWLRPDMPPELAPGELASTLEGGATVTLLGSGLALDPQALARRADDAAAAYLREHPDDRAGAEAAGLAARRNLEADVGPLVVPALSGPFADGQNGLSFAHLVPDVMGTDGRPGALRLCIKVGDVQQPAIPAAGQPGFPFRRRVPAWRAPEGVRSYTFRVFAAESFDAEGKECAGTSLTPIAELSVRSGSLEAGKAYTLVALGAIAPERLCGPSEELTLPRDSCTLGPEDLAARLVLLSD